MRWKPRPAAQQKQRRGPAQNIAAEQNETPPHMRYHIYHEVDGKLYHLNSVPELPDMTPSTFIDWHLCETFADIRAALGKSLSSPRVRQKRIVTPHVLQRDGESGPVVDERLDCSMGN